MEEFLKHTFMEVRAKKSLGQHFLTDLSIAQRIAESLIAPSPDASHLQNAAESATGTTHLQEATGTTHLQEATGEETETTRLQNAAESATGTTHLQEATGEETGTTHLQSMTESETGNDREQTVNTDVAKDMDGHVGTSAENRTDTPIQPACHMETTMQVGKDTGHKESETQVGKDTGHREAGTQAGKDTDHRESETKVGYDGRRTDVLEVGPGMGVLTQYLLQRPELSLKMVEIDRESVDYLLTNLPIPSGALIEADFLKLRLETFFKGQFCIIGNFPYNISSQIFFRILDYRNSVPQVVCMIQKEVAERIAEGPGSKTYGILSVLLQAWYDIEYLFTVGEGAFNPPPKVKSAVIRLTRNGRKTLRCDESMFKAVVKTAFNQRRKTMRNSLRPLINAKASREGWDDARMAAFLSDPVFDLRPERLGVEDFIALTEMF